MSDVAARRKQVDKIGTRVSNWVFCSVIVAIVGAIAFRIVTGGWPLNDGTWFFVFVFGGLGVVGLLEFILHVFIRPPAQPSQRLVASRDANDMPHVSWRSHDGERGTTLWGTPYEDVTQYIHMAEIDIYNGAFVVKRWGAARERIWVKDDGATPTREKIAIGDAATPKVICARPADEVKAFSIGEASLSELVSSDLALFRGDRLRFTEHNVVKVEFVNGQFGIISRDQQERWHTEEVIAALAREFIINRPPGGWSTSLKPIQEAAASAASRQKHIAQAAAHWAAPQAPPVNYEGRKFAAFIEQPGGAAVNTPIVEAERENLLDQKPDLWHRGSSWSYTTGTAYLPYLVTCTAAGVETDYNTCSLVTFHPPHHAQIGDTFGDTVKVYASGQDGARVWQKQMSKLVGIKSDTAKNFKMPPQYMVRGDVMPSDDATIFYLEFADGEVIPLCYAVKMPSTAFENWAATVQQAQAVCGTLPEKEVMVSPGSITTGTEGHDPI